MDPDPCVPARRCGCASDPRPAGPDLGIPERYADVSMEGFWEWWKRRHPDGQVRKELEDASALLENDVSGQSMPAELRRKLAAVLDKCGAKGGGDRRWKSIGPAQEPNGFGALKTWVGKDHHDVTLWWIDGPPGSGRSSLAAATLSAWCGERRKGGLYASVRALSQEIKDTYYDTRSWRNADFMSERDRMAPLEAAPFLVLDDFDRMDSDMRVVRAIAQLLDRRWGGKLPTVITAGKWAEALQFSGDAYPLMKLDDASLLRRLSQAHRVELVPTLSRLMRAT